MKKPVLILTVLMSSYSFGQITIGQWDVIGSGDQVTQNHDTLPTISLPTAGTNMTWDLSGLNQHDQTILNIGAASWFSGASNFPDATLGADDGSGFTIFLSKDANGLRAHGVNGDFFGTGEKQIHFDPADEMIRFPATFNDSYTTNTVQSFSILGSDIGQPIDSAKNIRHTTKEVVIDGWGTATTPYGTFPALRINTTSYYWDSTYVYLFGIGQLFDSYLDTSYTISMWSNDPTTKFPLAEISLDSTGTVAQSVDWLNSAPTAGISSMEVSQVDVYPNPASDYIQVNVSNKEQGNIRFYDVTGKMVLELEVDQNAVINVSNLRVGNYLYTIDLDSGKQLNGKLNIKR